MTHNAETLLALAARCEAATGPDREIDGWIWAYAKAGDPYIIGSEPGRFPQPPIWGEREDVMRLMYADPIGAAQYIGAPAFTASLDAAMTLVPEGRKVMVGEELGDLRWRATLSYIDPDNLGWRHPLTFAATPALALTAACLRAHAAEQRP